MNVKIEFIAFHELFMMLSSALLLPLCGPVQAQSVTAGQREFRQTCGFCHGPDGRGASGPDLIRSSLVSHDVNGNLIGPVVRNGRPERGMPAFPFSDDQYALSRTFFTGRPGSRLRLREEHQVITRSKNCWSGTLLQEKHISTEKENAWNVIP